MVRGKVMRGEEWVVREVDRVGEEEEEGDEEGSV